MCENVIWDGDQRTVVLCVFGLVRLIFECKFEFIFFFFCFQAAAAMCVGIGSFSDPFEAQGLAHFLGLDIYFIYMKNSIFFLNI